LYIICAAAGAAAKKVRVADRDRSHYPHRLVLGVDGMTCQNCQRRVENALNAMPGTWAAADLAAQQVSILTKESPDEAAIRQAIRDAGYLPLQ
jgi:copper chaperone